MNNEVFVEIYDLGTDEVLDEIWAPNSNPSEIKPLVAVWAALNGYRVAAIAWRITRKVWDE
jgi:hypothetical protein